MKSVKTTIEWNSPNKRPTDSDDIHHNTDLLLLCSNGDRYKTFVKTVRVHGIEDKWWYVSRSDGVIEADDKRIIAWAHMDYLDDLRKTLLKASGPRKYVL